ncbi:phage terminase small subunit P27 family [Seohaeicola nanhaiensis]|uniref:Phage terminase small subunit P27 family n=1 Tax=Seohaeicola nanhaiensis TaxID=1387282 RepID=A0ABV9KH15_9RHOB
MRGPKPHLGKGRSPQAPDALPRCPPHLTPVAAREWRRLAGPLHKMGVISTTDRAALAAYCQSWARWVEAEEKLRETPMLIRTPSGYAQQSPWLSIANKQMELMGKYMAELGLTPVARARLPAAIAPNEELRTIVRVIVRSDDDPLELRDGDVVEEGRGIRVVRNNN